MILRLAVIDVAARTFAATGAAGAIAATVGSVRPWRRAASRMDSPASVLSVWPDGWMVTVKPHGSLRFMPLCAASARPGAGLPIAGEKILIVGCGDVAWRAPPRLRDRYRVFSLLRDPLQAPLARRRAVPLIADLDHPASLHRIRGLADDVLHLSAAGRPERLGIPARRRFWRHSSVEKSSPQRLVHVSTSGVTVTVAAPGRRNAAPNRSGPPAASMPSASHWPSGAAPAPSSPSCAHRASMPPTACRSNV